MTEYPSKIVSRFKFGKVYLLVFGATLFFIGIGVFLMKLKPKDGVSEVFPVVFGILCILFAAFTLYKYLQQLPVIRIDASEIKLTTPFWQKTVSWSDIQDIQFTGKINFRFIPPFPMEATVLKLKDGNEIHFFYEHYRNGYLIQQFLQNHHNPTSSPAHYSEENISKTDLAFEEFETFKGRPLFSFRGLALWPFILFLLSHSIINYSPGYNFGLVAGICAFWYFVMGYFCFYIKLSSNYLIVKNYFLPFWSRTFRLSDIQILRIETYGRWPNCLRVTKKTFKYYVFPCGTLRDSDWKDFITQQKIEIVNECI